MRAPPTNDDAMTLGLGALGWAVSAADRADRLLALTGLDAGDLRAGAGEPATLAAVLGFLEGHEPDLVACAAALGTTPAALVAARVTLERP